MRLAERGEERSDFRFFLSQSGLCDGDSEAGNAEAMEMRTPRGREEAEGKRDISIYPPHHKRRASVLQTVKEETSRLIYVR